MTGPTGAGWLLDSAQQRALLSLPSKAFDDDTTERALQFAQLYVFRGDGPRAKAYADTALRVVTTTLRVAPDDPFDHVKRGVALAILGRRVEAIQEGERAARLMPLERNGIESPIVHHGLAFIYELGGQHERAITILESLLKVPYFLSPGWLRLDPAWARLRGNPRFERLIADPASLDAS